MGYDVNTVCPHCGQEFSCWSYTTNCAPMWREAGADLGDFDGKTASDCAPVLANAIRNLEAQPEHFKAMNPPNEFGSYETLLPCLRSLLNNFMQHPQAVVRVSR